MPSAFPTKQSSIYRSKIAYLAGNDIPVDAHNFGHMVYTMHDCHECKRRIYRQENSADIGYVVRENAGGTRITVCHECAAEG